jgi:hypothetical protein
MKWQDIHGALRREPFRPFRLHVADGGHYDIERPDLCAPGSSCVFIGIPGPEGLTFERYAIIDVDQVTRLEVLPAGENGGGRAARKAPKR